MKKRAILLVIDSLGVGAMKDVSDNRQQDIGADTFRHLLDYAQQLDIPNLENLGINNILKHPKLKLNGGMASYGIMNLMHHGADSFAGHQEIMGSLPRKPLLQPFAAVMQEVKKALRTAGYRVNIPDESNPYLLVNELVVVADNIETDYGQIYNVTGPLDYISYDEIVKIGSVVRQVVRVNRIIALGGQDVTPNQIMDSIERRQDGLIGVNSPKSGVYKNGYRAFHMGYGINPAQQVSSLLIKSQKAVTLIGKMQDIIFCEGATKIPAIKTEMVMSQIIQAMDNMKTGLIAATVQESDLRGHAQDVQGYADILMTVDKYLGTIIANMQADDILLITADHGNDPTIGHSQHTREKTFLLAYTPRHIKENIGERETLADIGATIAEYFDVSTTENGKSFLKNL